jgi:hypothetical protein
MLSLSLLHNFIYDTMRNSDRDARVMWDVNSGKSRGYGFVAFRDKTVSADRLDVNICTYHVHTCNTI